MRCSAILSPCTALSMMLLSSMTTAIALLYPVLPASAFFQPQPHPSNHPHRWPRLAALNPASSRSVASSLRLIASDIDANGDGDSSSSVITWNDATILSSEPACPSRKSLLWKVQLADADTNSFGCYTTPGQFLQLRRNGSTDPLFLAMCSPPSENNNNALEFLVKTTPNIPWLNEIRAGTTVQVSPIMGNGFAAAFKALEEESIDRLLLVAHGSGIAPLMACVRNKEWMDKVEHKIAYYGEWTLDDICFQDELAAGIDLVPCFSKQSTKGFWSGRVQTVLLERGVVHPETTLALVCGSTEMMEDVRRLLTKAGVKPERIVTNV